MRGKHNRSWIVVAGSLCQSNTQSHVNYSVFVHQLIDKVVRVDKIFVQSLNYFNMRADKYIHIVSCSVRVPHLSP